MNSMAKMIPLSVDEFSAATRMFSANVVRDLATKGCSNQFIQLASRIGLFSAAPNSTSIADFYDLVFQKLKTSGNRNEYVYRNTIIKKHLLGVHSLKTASLLQEFRVGTRKADLAILNGTSTVYEIKSERDNLSRLDSQVDSYRKVFASVNVITAESHLDNVNALLPTDVGILYLNAKLQISTFRKAQNRPERTLPTAILESISRAEAIKILELLQIEVPKLPNTLMHRALLEIFEKCDSKTIHDAMVVVLKEYRTQRALTDLIVDVPQSLYATVLSTPIRLSDYGRLIATLKKSKKDALKWA